MLQVGDMQGRLSNYDGGDWVYHAVKARVIAYEFPQGKRIYLQKIADELGISTWPVRQVFDRLAAEGLVVKAPRKGYFAMSLSSENVLGYYHITRHFLSLGLDTLDSKYRRALSKCEATAVVLEKLNRRTVNDFEWLARYNGEIFENIAALTRQSAVTFAVGRTNDHLFYVRTLECRQLGNVQNELICLCELVLAADCDELIAAIREYHERRISLLPELLEPPGQRFPVNR